MATKAVYQYDETLREHPTKVLSIRPISALPKEEQALCKSATDQTYALETAETIFYAQGGGQPFDLGTMTSSPDASGKESTFTLSAVRHGAAGTILHFGHFDPPASPFEINEAVTQHIDAARRALNSRIHTAGHLIALAIRALAPHTAGLDVAELKAQHYPDASFVEFQGLIGGELKEAIQRQTSAFVAAALPVRLYWYAPEELAQRGVIMAEGMPIVAGADGRVRVVDVIGAGAYACGGTHVPRSDAVGEVVVRGIKRQKGNSKVSYAVLKKDG